MSRAPCLTPSLQRGVEPANSVQSFGPMPSMAASQALNAVSWRLVVRQPARALSCLIGLAQQRLKRGRSEARHLGNRNRRNALRRRHDQDLGALARHDGRHQRAVLEKALPDDGIDAAFDLAAARSLLEQRRELAARGAQMLQGLRAFRALCLRELRPLLDLDPQRPVSGFFRWREGQGLLAQRGSKE